MEPVLYIYSEQRKRLIIAFEIDANYRGLKTNRRKESKVIKACLHCLLYEEYRSIHGYLKYASQVKKRS